MACEIISGITYNCLVNVGGVKKIYITNFENVSAYTENSIGTITGVTMAPATTFQEFQFNNNTSSIGEEATISQENGTTFYTQTVTLIIPRREAAKRDKILLLATGQPKLAIIVTDSNGLSWFVGLEEGAYLTANVTGSGVAKGDANNYQLTLTATERYLAPEVDAAALAAII
jgi:hypothetical protein